MRYADLFEQALLEGRDAPLYHGTEFLHAPRIISENAIGAFTEHEIAGKMQRGVSLTRDFRFAANWGEVVFRLDQRKLSQNRKLVPIDYHGLLLKKQRRQGFAAEAEEFHIGPLQPLDRYLTAILVRWKSIDEVEWEEEPRRIVLKRKPLIMPDTFAPLANHPLLKLVREWPTDD